MSDNLSESEKDQHYNFLIANAKVDALAVMVEALYVKNGSTQEKFRAALKTYQNACVQKYLEKIQEKLPRLAAEIDRRDKMPEIDQTILDSLYLDDEPQ